MNKLCLLRGEVGDNQAWGLTNYDVESEEAGVTVEAYAKVNLTLEVLRKRVDGYHEIASIVQTIDLHDTLVLRPASDVIFECNWPKLVSPDNLVMKATDLLRKYSGTNLGVLVSLHKRIPVSSGLGGGSSDAAAILKGLNTLWGLGLSIEDLTPIASQLGSDVPFFLRGGTAIVCGRGEMVRVLPPANLDWFVVMSPAITISNKTASIYGLITGTQYTSGQLTRKLEARIMEGGDVSSQLLFNAFDQVAPCIFPGLQSYWGNFESLGALGVHVAGGGPSLFALVSGKEQGVSIQLNVQQRHMKGVYVTAPWQPGQVQVH